MLLSDLVMEEYGDRLKKDVAKEVNRQLKKAAKEAAKAAAKEAAAKAAEERKKAKEAEKKAKEELKAKEGEFIETLLALNLPPEFIAEKMGCSKAKVLRIARKKPKQGDGAGEK